MRAKHCDGRCDVDMFIQKTDASNAWGGITDNGKFLGTGVKSEVGNGKWTLFWYHNWATN